MAKKKTAPSPVLVTEPDVKELPSNDLVRIEQSVEEFISQHLPNISSCRLTICSLYADKSGNNYFRCNFWSNVSRDSIIEDNMIICSYFIKISKKNGEKVFTDLTRIK